jgi:subtilisin family serine protease
MNRVRVVATGLVASAMMLGACVQDDVLQPLTPQAAAMVDGGGQDIQETGRFLILGRGERLPATLSESVEAAGGRLTSVLPEIGVAFAEGLTPGFDVRMARVNGIQSVTADVMLRWTEPTLVRDEVVLEAEGEDIGALALNPTDAFFLNLQYAPQAIQAPEAWNAGYTGKGVRVAIVDGGIRNARRPDRESRCGPKCVVRAGSAVQQ